MYLDLLTATFVVRQIRPWFENPGKRQVKSPKVYLSDSGRRHTLLGIESAEDLERQPKVTSSIRAALETLGLQRLDVVHAGDRTFPLAPRIRALALGRLLQDLRPLD
jgi:hypothetical protein